MSSQHHRKDEFFAPIVPFDSGYLSQDGYSIYYEQCGAPDGLPVLFLHGGPGAGCTPTHRRMFDPAIFRLILIDQRGCGRSEPYASVDFNTTQHLISDCEILRKKLDIPKWILFGGSWGSTLGLCYGIAHPSACLGFVLRGIFLGSRAEINWFLYDMGRFFPEAAERFCNFIPEAERHDLLAAYCKRLMGSDLGLRTQAAQRWASYENSCATLASQQRDAGPAALGLAVLEAHYFQNDCFLAPDHILNNLAKIAHLPAYIVQGRHDVICPPFSAYELQKQWGSQAQIAFVDDAGHSAFEKGISTSLIHALSSLEKMCDLKAHDLL